MYISFFVKNTCIFQVFVPNVLSVSDVCCKCFIWILLNLNQNVAYICEYFKCFIHMLQVFLSSCLHMFEMTTHMFSSFFLVFYKCFRYMLQVFYLGVVKIDWVLHLLQCV
jgi:hypothetical protein